MHRDSFQKSYLTWQATNKAILDKVFRGKKRMKRKRTNRKEKERKKNKVQEKGKGNPGCRSKPKSAAKPVFYFPCPVYANTSGLPLMIPRFVPSPWRRIKLARIPIQHHNHTLAHAPLHNWGVLPEGGALGLKDEPGSPPRRPEPAQCLPFTQGWSHSKTGLSPRAWTGTLFSLMLTRLEDGGSAPPCCSSSIHVPSQAQHASDLSPFPLNDLNKHSCEVFHYILPLTLTRTHSPSWLHLGFLWFQMKSSRSLSPI